MSVPFCCFAGTPDDPQDCHAAPYWHVQQADEPYRDWHTCEEHVGAVMEPETEYRVMPLRWSQEIAAHARELVTEGR